MFKLSVLCGMVLLCTPPARNCFSVAMQTFTGTNTISYPVGVFDINGMLLGNAATPAAYISLWNNDTADARLGTLALGKDSMHFNLNLNTGQSMPSGVMGLRYYQVDFPWTVFDGIRNINGEYVDFGDGTGMHLGKNWTDTPKVVAPNTTVNLLNESYYYMLYLVHTYPNANLKTLTFYHNDDTTSAAFDNGFNPATGLTKLQNLRGNIPQHDRWFGGSCYQQPSMTSIANIPNWSTINSIQQFFLNNGDETNPVENISYPQDFMAGNRGLFWIETNWAVHHPGNGDSTFKLTRLKSDWNTYFSQLQVLRISEDDWNHEDLSGLANLNVVQLVASSQVQDDPTSPLVPLDSTEIDNVFIQVAAGAGLTVSNGTLAMVTGGSIRTHASDAAYNLLVSKGWTIGFDTTTR
jgi:hypothetical protein